MSNVTILTQETNTLTDSLNEMNKALASMKTYYDNLNKTQERAVKLKKLNKNELRETVQDEEGLKKRTKILNTTLKLNNDMLTFGIKSLSDYRKAGGTTLEYLATFMTSTKEEVRLLGFEAASARRFMYGFLPPGMFRLVNKVATAFNGMGSAIRAVRDSASGANKESSSLFTTIASGVMSLSKIPKLSIKDVTKLSKPIKKQLRMRQSIKGTESDIKRLEERIKTGKRSGVDVSFMETRLKEQKNLLEKMEKSREKVTKKMLEKSALGRVVLNIGKFYKNLPSFKTVREFFGKALKFFLKGMIYMTLTLTVFYILYKTVGKTLIAAFKEALPTIKLAGQLIMGSISMIWSGITDIWNGFFGDGNLSDVIDGMIKIAVGIIGVAVGIIGAGLLFIGGMVKEFFHQGWIRFTDYLRGVGSNFSEKIGYIAGVAAFIVVVGAFIMSAPVWLAGLLGLIAYRLVRLLTDKLPFMANGGVSQGGLTVVGEKGPELVNLPRGARVNSNRDSKKMVGGKSVVNNFNITVNAKDSSKAEMRRMADEIGRMINSKINRSTSSSTFR